MDAWPLRTTASQSKSSTSATPWGNTSTTDLAARNVKIDGEIEVAYGGIVVDEKAKVDEPGQRESQEYDHAP